MQDKLTKIFQEAKYQPPQDLTDIIWLSIVAHNKKMIKIKSWVLALVGLISLTGIIPAFQMLQNDLSRSGFYEYFSLLFGSGSILSYWKELALSLAESMPAISLLSILSLLFIFFLSMRYLMKQINRNQLILSI